MVEQEKDFIGQRQRLTPNQRIEVAYMHFVLGLEQQAIAGVMRINSGRINEACKAIKEAADSLEPTSHRRKKTRR